MRKYKCKYTKKHARERGLPLYALIAVMLFSVLPLSGCGREAGPESVRIGSLKGPTSLGILDLMDRAEKGETKHPYEFRMAVGADELLPLMAKGELDMALIPANVAAVLYHKTEGGVCVVDINTLGVLYLVTGDEAVAGPADLKGRTICLTGKGATPEASLRYVLDRSGLGEGDYVLEYRSEPTEVAALLAEDSSRVGLLPQPFATAALMQNGNLRIAMDMNAQWEQLQGGEGGGMVTGVTVVRREFLEEHEDVVEDFLEQRGRSQRRPGEGGGDGRPGGHRGKGGNRRRGHSPVQSGLRHRRGDEGCPVRLPGGAGRVRRGADRRGAAGGGFLLLRKKLASKRIRLLRGLSSGN